MSNIFAKYFAICDCCSGVGLCLLFLYITFGFLTFLEGIETENWAKIDYYLHKKVLYFVFLLHNIHLKIQKFFYSSNFMQKNLFLKPWTYESEGLIIRTSFI